MRNVTIYYRDNIDMGREEYQAGPYPAIKAKDVEHNLSLMGCWGFRRVIDRAA